MTAQIILSILGQLAISLVCALIAYRMIRWFGQPIQGDERAQAALEKVHQLNRHAREQSQSILQRELH
jgi:hypothetical protein